LIFTFRLNILVFVKHLIEVFLRGERQQNWRSPRQKTPLMELGIERGNDAEMSMDEIFRKFAGAVSRWAGSSWAFTLAILVLCIWAVSGPIFHFSDTWQLVINTGTTIVTFLMVFLIQNTQNREARAINLKLDEIIRSIQEAHNSLIDLENASEEQLEEVEQQFKEISEEIQDEQPAFNGQHPASKTS
jgi:low affinity Fe/Cu permease